MARKDDVGRDGEDLARRWLEQSGLEVIERNWRCREGEIDLVALDGDDLVIVEVKTRRTLRLGHPAEAVTPRKLARLRRLAGLWLTESARHASGVRVDVIAVWMPDGHPARVDHIQGVG